MLEGMACASNSPRVKVLPNEMADICCLQVTHGLFLNTATVALAVTPEAAILKTWVRLGEA